MAKSENPERQKKIKAIMDMASAELTAMGVNNFIGAVDRDPASKDGGKAYSQADLKGEDFKIILQLALPTRQDIVNLALWVGGILNDTKKD